MMGAQTSESGKKRYSSFAHVLSYMEGKEGSYIPEVL